MEDAEEQKVFHLQGEAMDDTFFIESYSSSEVEEEPDLSDSSKLFAKFNKDSSGLPLLAFSITSRKAPQNTKQASRADLEEQEEDSDLSVEEWMILGGEDQVEDSSIQLNLSNWTDEAGRDTTEESVTSHNDTWAVSDKDKYGSKPPLVGRYFFPGRSSFCHHCFKTGHAAKSCSLDKKSPTCVLCGTQGHIQKNCPGRPCLDCGLPSHGVRPCTIPPVWNQHCRRCGMRGHLSFTCPDTWRQYHQTVRPGAPLRSRSVFHKIRAHCYNCSKRGHYGYECVRIRMVRGTFPTLPYVCHYDSLEDVLQRQTRIQMGLKGQEHSEISDEKNENESLLQGRNKTKQGTRGRRKTWPERRRERRQVKQLRRKAQAVREGGLLGRSCFDSEDEGGSADFSKKALTNNRWSKHPSEKKANKKELNGGKKRKSKFLDIRRKKKIKRKDFHSYEDENLGGEKLFSPNQRIRHRR